MKSTIKNLKITLYILLLCFIILIISFSFLEYNWFNSIAKKEYNKTYSTLFLNTNRISNREFDRISMYTNWFDNYIESSVSNSQLEIYLEYIYKNSNISTLDKNVIKSLSYITISDLKEHTLQSFGWQTKIIDNSYLEKVIITDNIYIDNNEELSIYIQNSQERIIKIDIDLKKFSELYIIPAIKEINFDIDINWYFQSNDTANNNIYYEKFISYQDYHFNPLNILLFNHNIHEELIIPITKKTLNYNFNKKPIFENEYSFIDKDSLFTIENEKIFSYINISIKKDDNLFASYIEKTLSYIFIGGFFLISLIAFICILLIYQLIRIKNQHYKEREFSASITHELRTPLTVIQSASDNLSANLIKQERVSSYGKLIKQQSSRLNTMIENLLVYSKLENNKGYIVNQTPTNLNNLINTINTHFIQIAKEKDIKISWTKMNLDHTVIIDRNLLELIINNLINNSIHHAYNNTKGEIRIFIQYSNQKNILNCSVEDDGVGINKKEKSKVWNSYYRGKDSVLSQQRGSGLGLFIVKRNISILGGKISLTSPYKRLDGSIKNGVKFDFYINCKEKKK